MDSASGYGGNLKHAESMDSACGYRGNVKNAESMDNASGYWGNLKHAESMDSASGYRRISKFWARLIFCIRLMNDISNDSRIQGNCKNTDK